MKCWCVHTTRIHLPAILIYIDFYSDLVFSIEKDEITFTNWHFNTWIVCHMYVATSAPVRRRYIDVCIVFMLIYRTKRYIFRTFSDNCISIRDFVNRPGPPPVLTAPRPRHAACRPLAESWSPGCGDPHGHHSAQPYLPGTSCRSEI